VTGGAGSTITVNGVDTGWFSGVVGVGADYNGDGLVDDADFVAYAEIVGGNDWSGSPGSTARITFTDGLGREGLVVISNTVDDFNTLYADLNVGESNPTRFREYRASIFVKDIDGDTYTAAAVTNGGVVSGEQLSVALSLGGGGADTTIDLDFRNTTFLWDDPGPVGASAIEFSGLETSERALLALTSLSNKRQELSDFLGGIGAFESRLNSALAVLAAARENSEAAASRIRDVDIGAESANLIRLGLLQQAGAAVLAQANIQPNLALSLLR
jgi:flagellin-like hook-associated protein FlgL